MQNLHSKNNQLTIWLSIMCFAIISTIFIGGVTRLTNAGLSITEWKPITGIMPPADEELWAQEFDKYKQSPEYLKLNKGMGLSEFKSIFWIEFIHRSAGRITGILYLLPLLYFLFNGTISGKRTFTYLGGLMLLVGQGFAGWYMVKSGLESTPHVSHFRLAIHLLLAMLLYALLFWELLKNTPYKLPESLKIPSDDLLNTCINVSLILLFIQIIFGAFVAGLHAGLVYNTFPLMGDSLVPSEITSTTFGLASFSDPVFIQFIHRLFALLVTITIVATYFISFKIDSMLLAKALALTVLVLIAQVAAGISTIVYMVPIPSALSHQLGSVALLSGLLWVKYLLYNAQD